MKAVTRSLRLALVSLVACLGAFSLAVAGFTAPALADTALTPGPAPIEQRSSTTVTSDQLPTVQIDAGVVWAQEIVGNIVYAGGAFSNARPAGAAPGTSLIPRSNLLAYDITTGVITSFAPKINGTVKTVKASPDGKRLYVGGSFNSVDGQTRWNLAAFDVASGTLLGTFKAAVGGSFVNAIAVTDSAVYVGGLLGAGNGVARKGFAAFNTSGQLLGWAPTSDLQVDAMTLTPQKDKLIVGGRFGTINGVTQRGLAALDLSTGALLPWAAPNTIKNGTGSGTGAGKAGIWGLSTDQNAVYGTGWVFASVNVGNLEGSFAAEPGSGNVRWIADCHGDSYGVYSDGTTVYTTSHAHACESVGGMVENRPSSTRNAMAMTAAPKGTLSRSPFVGSIYADWSGYPGPAIVNWFPDWLTGKATGMGQAGFSIVGTGGFIAVGGEFVGVNNQRQQGLVRFSAKPAGGAKQGPRLSGSSWTPTAKSVASGTARVSIPANWDRDDLSLSYSLMRVGREQPVATATMQSTYWKLPTVTLTDTGLTPGSSQSYYVVASDPNGNKATSAQISVQISDAAASPYATAVLNDKPSLYWPLGGAAATTAVDWAGSNDGKVGAGVGTTAAGGGAIAADASPASTFNGTTDGTIGSTKQLPAPTAYSTELWFKTTTTSGGKLLGYGSANSGTSSAYDRHVYMLNNGLLTFGTYPGTAKTVTSGSAYNDGAWHHVVATQGPAGMALYVDGKVVGQDERTTTTEDYVGYWRIGGDNLNNWPNRPANSSFTGTLDNFAAYDSVLTPAQVASHYALGTGQGVPTARFTATVNGLTSSFDAGASTAPSGQSIASYTWDFGDGTPSATGTTVNHAYAAPGTYTVALTVTTGAGVPATTTRAVTTTTPNKAPVAAFNAGVTGLAVSVDGSASADADGSVASFAWDFGDGSVGTGKSAAHSYAAAGSYKVTLVVTDNQGLASGAVTKSVTVQAVPVNGVARDVFDRTVSNGWGAADAGGSWSLTGSSAMFNVSGGAGKMALPAGSTRLAMLKSVSSTDTDSRVSMMLDSVPTGGGNYASVVGRQVGSSSYSMKTWAKADGSVALVLLRDSTTLRLNNVPGLTYSANTVLHLRLQVTGTSPTTVQGKIWKAGETEPANWQATATDNTAALQSAGGVGLGAYLSGSAKTPVTTAFDDYAVTSGTAPAALAAPLAGADARALKLEMPAKEAGPGELEQKPAAPEVQPVAPVEPVTPAAPVEPALPAAPAAEPAPPAPPALPAPPVVPVEPAAPVAGVPTAERAVVVVMKNQSAENVLGNPDAPFINSLAGGGAAMTQSFAVAEADEPNYLALFSGATQGLSNDSCPHSYSTSNIASQLMEAGLTFTGFAEGLPSAGYVGCESGKYSRKHNSWVNWPAIPATANQPLTAFPTDYSKLPALSFVIPHRNLNTGSGSIAQDDAWLKQNLGGYAAWAQQNNSLLIITWDHGGDAGTRIPTIITGQKVVPGAYPEKITHYNVLRTLQEAFELPATEASGTAAPITNIWSK